MRIVFDTNVVLDVLVESALRACGRRAALVEVGRIDGLPCATTATTNCDIAATGLGHGQARTPIAEPWEDAGIAPFAGDVPRRPLGLASRVTRTRCCTNRLAA